MDRRLIEAAQTGDVPYLLSLIKEDPLLLRAIALTSGETPLHIASMAGHLNFIKEIINLRQEFASELNQDGFSPLHIASANGDLEIVKELLRVDLNLCLLKGRERRIPLHCAGIKGRVQVIKELLSANIDSVFDVTARGETALHLAVKNNQFEAIRYMVEHLKQFKKEDVLNKKDDSGNTILHLAVSRKQYEVVDLVLNEQVMSPGLVEVNSLNKRGLTPLDVLLLEDGDSEIEDILRHFGATKADNLHSLAQTGVTENCLVTIHSSSDNQSRTERRQSPAKRWENYFKYDGIKESSSKTRNTLLVIAILIATATYQAVLSPPGGVWQDDFKLSDNNRTNGTTPHTAGQSVMGTHNQVAYGLFLVFNSIGFFMSLHMINFVTVGFPLKLELQVSIVALIVTYDTSMTALAPNDDISLLFTIVSIVLPFIIPVATRFVRNHMMRTRISLACTSQGTH